MINDETLTQYPLTRQALDYIQKKFIFFRSTSDYIRNTFDEKYLTLSEEMLHILKKKAEDTDIDFNKSMDAFIKYSFEFLKLQDKLNKMGRYLYSSYNEVNQAVYQNRDVMEAYYLDGLFISELFWPNHYLIGEYFCRLSEHTDSTSKILDVAPGAGIFSFYTARNFQFQSLDAMDISSWSVAYVNSILKYSSLTSDRITIKNIDIFQLDSSTQYDMVICGELLEHLEKPDELLKILHTVLKADGKLFLTTAIYAAAIDHIYLFENVEDVQQMLSAQFDIKSELILPTSLKTYEPSMNRVPINYACVLEKKR